MRELQGYRNPPEKIKLALSSCVALVKNLHAEPNWTTVVLPALKDAGFKNSILEFAKENISPKCKEFVVRNYISKEAYDIDAFFRASRALGPLAEWTKSIIEFADIFERIAPMREEL